MSTSDQQLMKASARVMLGYISAFVLAVLVQVVAKVNFIRKRNSKKTDDEEPFNRYSNNDDFLLAADRAVGNFVEWAPAFLTLYWTHIAVAGDCTTTGWLYVGARLLYPFVAVLGGIRLSGARPIIYLSTVPGYFVLLKLAYGIVLALV